MEKNNTFMEKGGLRLGSHFHSCFMISNSISTNGTYTSALKIAAEGSSKTVTSTNPCGVKFQGALP
jgi:hypothetical protein